MHCTTLLAFLIPCSLIIQLHLHGSCSRFLALSIQITQFHNCITVYSETGHLWKVTSRAGEESRKTRRTRYATVLVS
ncbi:hypothetical protein BDR07DRAFT_1413401 [Suillus spraguei]|nr:hypothetical protein BDR07DRAFT_1413401 [Suillus spraguei]